MYIKLSCNTFVRYTDRYGYICNQLTRSDRNYNQTGMYFLKELSREPRNVDEILNSLYKQFDDVNLNEVREDFLDFVDDLAYERYILVGDTPQQCNEKDYRFTYAVDAESQMVDPSVKGIKREPTSKSTTDYFLEEFQGHPIISTLQFELTSRCNERCIHCYIPNSKKNKGFDMPLKTVKNVLDQFREMGGIQVTLSGGELFMHKDVNEIIRYCREKDLKITILTNLISLTDENLEVIKAANIHLLQVSLYSMNPEIHDMITTVKGSFSKTIASIHKLVKNDVPIQISCPVMKANWKGYKDVVEFGKSLKIIVLTDYLLMARADLSTDNLANRIDVEEVGVLLKDILEHDQFYQEQVERRQQEKLTEKWNDKILEQPVCGVGYDNCCISANGDVYPCAGWQDYVIGNIYKKKLSDIWQNSEKVRVLRRLKNKLFPQCIECEALDYCSRCLVRNYNESNGNFMKLNPHFCAVAFKTKEIVDDYLAKKDYHK